MNQEDIIEMAKKAGIPTGSRFVGGEVVECLTLEVEAFAKLVAAHAVAKDRKEFDIDELCARQNKIGYKQGYNAGVLAEREACAKVCDKAHPNTLPAMLGMQIRARGEA